VFSMYDPDADGHISVEDLQTLIDTLKVSAEVPLEKIHQLANTFEDSTLHVKGVGGMMGEETLLALFGVFGTVVQAIVRREKDERSGDDTSWALVTMKSVASCERAIATTPVNPETGEALIVHMFSKEKNTVSFGELDKLGVVERDPFNELVRPVFVVDLQIFDLLDEADSDVDGRHLTATSICRWVSSNFGVLVEVYLTLCAAVCSLLVMYSGIEILHFHPLGWGGDPDAKYSKRIISHADIAQIEPTLTVNCQAVARSQQPYSAHQQSLTGVLIA
jgi:hypothetical protein